MSLPAALHPPTEHSCPGCHAPLEETAGRCVACGYSAAACLERFPHAPPRWERFIDPDGQLDDDGRRRAGRLIDVLEARFPQVRVVIALVRLPADEDGREFGFWLFNAATPCNEREHRLRQRSILLVLDTGNAAASWTVGYGLESVLDDAVLREILAAGVDAWRRNDWARGLADVVQRLDLALVAAHRRTAGTAAADAPGKRAVTSSLSSRSSHELA